MAFAEIQKELRHHEREDLINEIERLRATIARVRDEIDAQAYRHKDGPCTDRCYSYVCNDILKALEEPTTGVL